MSRRRSRLVLAGAAALALAAGLAAGFAAQRAQDPLVALGDETGSLAVTVPESWSAAVATGQWTPPEQDQRLPALSAGTTRDWATAEDGEGVFVGVLATDDMPEELPGHAGCESTLDPLPDVVGDDAVLTQVSSGCPGVIIERVRQVAVNRYLWVQVRSHDRTTAYSVLGDVSAPGF